MTGWTEYEHDSNGEQINYFDYDSEGYYMEWV